MGRLLFILFSVCLVSFSCDRKTEDGIVFPEQQVKDNITGQWIMVSDIINGVPELYKINTLLVYEADMTGMAYLLFDAAKNEFYPNYTFDYTISQSGEVVLDADYGGYRVVMHQQIIDLNEQFLIMEWNFGNDKHLSTFQRYYGKIVVVPRR